MARSTGSWREDDEGRAREILEIVQQLKDTFAARNELYERIDRVVYREEPVVIPDAYRATAVEVRSPLATHIANTVTAALSVNPPTVMFEPIGFGDAAQENSTLRERFFEAAWRRQEEEARRRLFRVFMYSLVTKGEAILKTVHRTHRAWAGYTSFSRKLAERLDAELERGDIDAQARERLYDAETEEFKRSAPFPIHTIDVPPETFYYIRGEDGFTFAAEVKRIPYYEALARYGERFGLSRDGRVVPAAMGMPRADAAAMMSDHRGQLTLIEAWTWRDVVYILQHPNGSGGMIVKTVQHGYGNPDTRTLRGPYFHAHGLLTSSRLPEYAGLSILFPFLDLFPLLDSLLTVNSNAAYLTGFPAFKEIPEPGTLPEPSDGADEVPRIEAGRLYPYNIQPVELPKAGVEFDKFLGRLQAMLEMALPAVATGSLQGDPSGYAFNQAAYMARLAWQPIIDNAEFALSELIGFMSWLIENKIRETVYVWGALPKGQSKKVQYGWLGIGPDDLKGVHRYKVRLDPETPSNKVILVRMYSEMLDRKLIGPYTAIQEMGGNPDEVEREWLLYELKQQPEIKRELFKRVFNKLGTLDQQALGGQEGVAAALGMPAGAAGAQAMGQAVGDALGQIGQVFTAGQNLPVTPTPPGAVSGAGPRASSAPREPGGAMPGNPPGTPVSPSLPANHISLPGQEV